MITTIRAARHALCKAGISLENLEFDRTSLHIFVDRGDGVADVDETNALREQVGKVIDWSGFMTGYGGYVLKPNYIASEVDVNNLAHPRHY